jgi:hypothetical protein
MHGIHAAFVGLRQHAAGAKAHGDAGGVEADRTGGGRAAHGLAPPYAPVGGGSAGGPG